MNLANRLTMLRIFMIPVFMFFLLVRIPYGDVIAAIIFIVAASTDGLDGYIARKRRQITNLGKLLDPLADKMLVTAALITLVDLGKVPAWIAVVILGREFFVTGLRGVAASEGIVIAASILGKVKTVSQILALTLLLLNDYIQPMIGLDIGIYALYAAVVFTLWSGYDYISKTISQIKLE
ncbi:MAG TPA: CDP-diacylglycerol--glycerol-3-phosphate 3-phosphatidyltransferase [Peptococcaceae bacterium]|nr:CDP-diacylglycerol--glycerol-3-phosphate 3-phosphatidyltransferase [Peptococcaceae bacterium]